jgi:glucans biosynthesis protein
MHGGAWGSGAPIGNNNALKHGFFSSEALEERTQTQTLLREAHKLLLELK